MTRDRRRIQHVALEIGYANGMINRYHSRAEFLSTVNSVLGADGVTAEDLDRLEAWLCTLSKEQLLILAAGEHSEMAALESLAPKGGPDNTPLTGLFNDISEGGV